MKVTSFSPIPADGEYQGYQTGQTVKFRVGVVNWQATTDQGVRGINEPCIVKVKDGYVSIEQY